MTTLQRSTAHKARRFGLFLLLTLAVAHSQSANPPAPANKTADAAPSKKTADEKTKKEAVAAAAKKKAEEKAEADKTAAVKAAEEKAAAAAISTGPWHVAVDAVATDQLSLDVTALYPSLSDKTTSIPGTACGTQDLMCKRLHLVLTDTVVKDQLKQLHHGDHIQVVYSVDTAKRQNTLKALSVDSVPAGGGTVVILGSALVCLLLYCALSGFRPWQLIIGEDNRYSNSRFQMALWFFVLITTYIATVWLRVWAAGGDFIGGVDIPKNLLLLSGVSALTFGGAKGITANKDAAAGAPQKTRADKPNFFFDLTHSDGTPETPAQPAVGAQPAVPARPAVPPQFDFGDFQMLVITLIAVVTYIVLIFNFFNTIEYSKIVNLPDVDTTLLAAFGLGQGAYLTKKAVGNVGTS